MITEYTARLFPLSK